MIVSTAPVSKWRIVKSGTWPRDHLDMFGPAYLRIDADGTGEMAFGALSPRWRAGSLQAGSTSTGTVPMKAIG